MKHKLFQKRVARTTFDIYVFMSLYRLFEFVHPTI